MGLRRWECWLLLALVACDEVPPVPWTPRTELRLEPGDPQGTVVYRIDGSLGDLGIEIVPAPNSLGLLLTGADVTLHEFWAGDEPLVENALRSEGRPMRDQGAMVFTVPFNAASARDLDLSRVEFSATAEEAELWLRYDVDPRAHPAIELVLHYNPASVDSYIDTAMTSARRALNRLGFSRTMVVARPDPDAPGFSRRLDIREFGERLDDDHWPVIHALLTNTNDDSLLGRAPTPGLPRGGTQTSVMVIRPSYGIKVARWAHELGHFFGLEHTSDPDDGDDPIADTPSCTNPDDRERCRDGDNVMFPKISERSRLLLTEEQRLVVSHALAHQEPLPPLDEPAGVEAHASPPPGDDAQAPPEEWCRHVRARRGAHDD